MLNFAVHMCTSFPHPEPRHNSLYLVTYNLMQRNSQLPDVLYYECPSETLVGMSHRPMTHLSVQPICLPPPQAVKVAVSSSLAFLRVHGKVEEQSLY